MVRSSASFQRFVVRLVPHRRQAVVGEAGCRPVRLGVHTPIFSRIGPRGTRRRPPGRPLQPEAQVRMKPRTEPVGAPGGVTVPLTTSASGCVLDGAAASADETAASTSATLQCTMGPSDGSASGISASS